MLETIIEHGPPVADCCAHTEAPNLRGDGLSYQRASDQHYEDDLTDSADEISTRIDEQLQVQSLLLAAADSSPLHDTPSAPSPQPCDLSLRLFGITGVYGPGSNAVAGNGRHLEQDRPSDQRAESTTAQHPIQSTEPRAVPSVRWNLIDAYSKSRDQPARVGVLCSLTTPSAAESRRPKLQADIAPGKAYQTQMSNRQQALRPTAGNRSAAGSPPNLMRQRRPDWQSGNPTQTAAPIPKRATASLHASRARLFDEDNLEQVSIPVKIIHVAFELAYLEAHFYS